jgi:hypothetical protein
MSKLLSGFLACMRCPSLWPTYRAGTHTSTSLFKVLPSFLLLDLKSACIPGKALRRLLMRVVCVAGCCRLSCLAIP